MINVILADHQPIFRAGTARVLAAEEDIRIVGQPVSPEQFMSAVQRFRPHVAVLSKEFLAVLPALKELAKKERTALLMLAEKGEFAPQCVALGFQGVIYRSADPKTVVTAVRRLAEGEGFVQQGCFTTQEVSAHLTGARARDRLSTTELRIINSVMHGYKNREIAQQLGTTEQSVKSAIKTIFDKLGISDRLELALYVLFHKPLASAVAAHTPETVRSSYLKQAFGRTPDFLIS